MTYIRYNINVTFRKFVNFVLILTTHATGQCHEAVGSMQSVFSLAFFLIFGKNMLHIKRPNSPFTIFFVSDHSKSS